MSASRAGIRCPASLGYAQDEEKPAHGCASAARHGSVLNASAKSARISAQRYNGPSAVDRPNSPPPGVDVLAPAVYDELRRLAGALMRRERPGQTLQPTGLVHEAYLRLAHAGTPWIDERHLVGIAGRSRRQILVERARARGAQKRWAGLDRVTFTDALAAASDEDVMLPALDEALTRLESLDPEQARIIELRYFMGMGIDETAAALGMSAATLKRRWALARAWLFRELSGDAAPAAP
jgi:RNA polymerase sigma-70 factor (ECF subfamily)